MENDLNKVLDGLSWIEDTTDKLIEDNEEEKKKLVADFDLKKKEFDKKLKEESDARLLDIQEELKAQHAQKLEDLRNTSERERAKQDRLFNKDREEMISAIMKNILEG